MAAADAGITDEPNSRLRDTGHTVFLTPGDRFAVGVGTGHPEALTVVVADPGRPPVRPGPGRGVVRGGGAEPA